MYNVEVVTLNSFFSLFCSQEDKEEDEDEVCFGDDAFDNIDDL